MTYGRLSAGTIRLVPANVVYQGQMLSNPPGDFLEDNNWKPVVFVLPHAEGLEMHWSEETNCIVQVWSTPASTNESGNESGNGNEAENGETTQEEQ